MSTTTGTCRNHGFCLLGNMSRTLVYIKWQANYSKGVVSRYYILLYYTIMVFSPDLHDVICTRKINIDRGGSRGQFIFFWCISQHAHQLKRP